MQVQRCTNVIFLNNLLYNICWLLNVVPALHLEPSVQFHLSLLAILLLLWPVLRAAFCRLPSLHTTILQKLLERHSLCRSCLVFIQLTRVMCFLPSGWDSYPGWSLCPDSRYFDWQFSWFSSVPPSKCLALTSNQRTHRFVSNPFQLVAH